MNPGDIYRNEGETGVADIPGFVLCTFCSNCPLPDDSEYLEPDGIWYCSHFQRWLRATDILHYRCSGFRRRSCAECRHLLNDRCKGVPNSVCYSYSNSRIRHRTRRMAGRRHPDKTSDPAVLALEERYNAVRWKETEESYGREERGSASAERPERERDRVTPDDPFDGLFKGAHKKKKGRDKGKPAKA